MHDVILKSNSNLAEISRIWPESFGIGYRWRTERSTAAELHVPFFHFTSSRLCCSFYNTGVNGAIRIGVRQKLRVNANAVRFGEMALNALEYEANPLTPTLSPLWRGERDGERFEHLTITRNRTLRIESDSNVIGSG